MAEVMDQRQREPLHHKLRYGGGHEAETVDAGALGYVARDDASERRIRRVVERIHGEHEHIGDGGIDGHKRLVGDAWIPEGQHIEHAEGQRRPEHPRPVFTPARGGAVGHDADERVDEGIDERRYEQHHARHGAVESEDVGIELQLIDYHHLEGQVGPHVTE